MGLVALVNNGSNLHGIHEKGDILVVKLEDSPWGRNETKEFARIYLEDTELENRLLQRRQSGEANPQICYPYAVQEGENMTKISSVALDIDNLSSESLSLAGIDKNKLEDRKTEVNTLRAGTINKYFKLTDLNDKTK